VAITLWLDPKTAKPTRIRWGTGANLWQDARVERFQQLPDDARHRALLELGG
jgi:hypothetical protein